MKTWYDFYKDRINSNTYQEYFEDRYKPMIDVIDSLSPIIIREEGIGIGSLSKALRVCNDYIMYGFDLCPQMVDLCKRNTHGIIVYEDNIISPKAKVDCTCVVTHGVLEHFEDSAVKLIVDRYNKNHIQYRVHYVPTDGYDSPSFGDERLLPALHWLNLVKPKDYLLFNDDKDLLLIN